MLVLIPHHGLKQVAHILHDEELLSSARSSLSHTPPGHTPVWSPLRSHLCPARKLFVHMGLYSVLMY